MSLRFIKMHGLGNDFVLIDDVRSDIAERSAVDSRTVRALCDRRYGVGADQLIWLLPSRDSDVLVKFFNADGSEAEMCGNGIRAVAVYLRDSDSSPNQENYQAETAAGIQRLGFAGSNVRVEMGCPRLTRGFESADGRPLRVGGREIRVFDVNVGNPHAVIFVDRLSDFPAETIGPELERHSDYPARTNVEFVEVVGPSRIRVKVWERGAGFTLACGTGASAAAVAGIASGRVTSPVRVELPGGELVIEWKETGAPVVMTGPAVEVYRGEADVEAILASIPGDRPAQ